jgi:hypothetical protein
MTWLVTGNANTTDSHFLGTTNPRPLVIKTNGAEALRVTEDGRVAIGGLGGPRSPGYRLDVQGTLNADEVLKGGSPLAESQWTTVGGGIAYEGGEVGIGARISGYKLNVDGVLNAADVHKDGAPLVGSQWQGESGGISYAGGSVGIGIFHAVYKLNVDGIINAREFRRNGRVLVGSQWTDVAAVGISYGSSVGIGKAPAPPYKLEVAGSINATDIHKNGKPLVESQWASAASGDLSYVGGNVGMGTTDPGAGLEIDKGSTNDLALLLSSSGPGWGSGVQFRNTAQDGKTYGIYSGWGTLHFADVDNGVDRLIIHPSGEVAIRGSAIVGAGGWGRLKIRHIDGKHFQNDNDDGLFLNRSTRQPVFVGYTDAPANLLVGGNVGIGTTQANAKLVVSGTSKAVSIDPADNNPNVAGALGFNRNTPDGRIFDAGFNAYQLSAYKAGLFFEVYNGTGGLVAAHALAISSNGNVGIGTASPGARLSVEGGGATVNGVAIGTDVPGINYPYEYETVGVIHPHWNLRLQSPNAVIFHTGDAPTQKMLIAENGDVTMTGRLGTGNWPAQPRTPGWGGGIHTWDVEAEGTMWSRNGYRNGSDARTKTNVAELSDVLDKLEAIRGVSFERLGSHAPSAPSEQGRNIGVIAQEVETAFPELVSEHGDEGHKAVDYSGLTGILVEAAKELKAENEALKTKLNSRNDELANLGAANNELQSAMEELRLRIEALELA